MYDVSYYDIALWQELQYVGQANHWYWTQQSSQKAFVLMNAVFQC